LIPKVAIGRSDIWTNNPAFGLNALGGAISFQMKDGFTYSGTEFDTSGGSYGRVGGSLQYGVRNGEWGLYLAAEGLKDDAWRYQSPSRLARFYGDLGWKGTDAEIHLVTSAADNYFGVIGPTPVELLANDYRAIYTWPQTTKNEAALVALNGRYSVTEHWTVQSNLYYRRFNQQHVDGNAAEIERCSGVRNNPLFNLGHRRPDLHQGANDRRLVAGTRRRQGVRSRQQLRYRRERRSQQDRVPGQ
jgi:iron complex outermembrane recepter protein